MGYSVMDIRPVTISHNFTLIISTPFSTVNSTSPLCRLNRNIASSASVSDVQCGCNISDWFFIGFDILLDEDNLICIKCGISNVVLVVEPENKLNLR